MFQNTDPEGLAFQSPGDDDSNIDQKTVPVDAGNVGIIKAANGKKKQAQGRCKKIKKDHEPSEIFHEVFSSDGASEDDENDELAHARGLTTDNGNVEQRVCQGNTLSYEGDTGLVHDDSDDDSEEGNAPSMGGINHHAIFNKMENDDAQAKKGKPRTKLSSGGGGRKSDRDHKRRSAGLRKKKQRPKRSKHARRSFFLDTEAGADGGDEVYMSICVYLYYNLGVACQYTFRGYKYLSNVLVCIWYVLCTEYA